jgi:hypothetical protein
VDNSDGVRRRQSRQQLAADPDHVTEWNSVTPEACREILSFDELHDDVRTGPFVDDVMDGGDIAVIDAGGCARFVQDARVLFPVVP